jgi:nitroreductase
MQDILKLMQERQSARWPFDPQKPIAEADLQQILEAGRWAPTAHNMQNFQIVVVDDRKLLEAIANIRNPVSTVFVDENYEQLSFSEEELLRRKTGVLGAMFPPSWRLPKAQRTAALLEGEASRPMPACPVLLLVLYDPTRRAPASEGDFLGIISLGCMTENMWLAANALGIGFHVVSSLAAGPSAQEVRRLLDIPAPFELVFGVRLGYPAAAPGRYLRVRRDLDDFTHRNRFGSH